MDTIKKISEKLTDCVHTKLSGNLEAIDTQELGLVVDMIKDIAEAQKYATEAEYYKKVKEAMEESELKHYTEPRRTAQGGNYGYYNQGGTNTQGGSNNGENNRCGAPYSRYYTEPMRNMMRPEMAVDYYDDKMGRAGQSRKMYMEHKEQNPESSNTVDVKRYADDLSEDIKDLMAKIKMSTQEKQVLKQTLLNTANSI